MASTVAARTAARLHTPQRGHGGTGPPMLVVGSGTADLGALTAWGSSNEPLYPGDDTYPGPGTFPQGPPLGGTFLSDQLSPYARVAVEAAFGAEPAGDEDDWEWTDITGDVRLDSGIKLRHGRSDEAAKPQPATMSCVLDNRAGRYSQAPGTLHYPYVRRGVPIRVSVNLGENLDNATIPGRSPGLYPALPLAPPQATYRVLWQGNADGFSPDWDRTGLDATATLSASGVLRRLSQGTAPAPSMMRRYIPLDAASKGLIGYWPMEDGESSSTIAPGLPGLKPMAIIGTPNLAKAKRVRQTDPVLQIHGARMSGALLPYKNSGDPTVVMNCLIDMEDDGTYTGDDAEIVRIWLTGGTLAYVGLKVRYNSNPVGIPKIFARAAGASSDISTENVGFRTLIDFPVVVRMRIQQVGSDVKVRLSTRDPGALTAGGYTWTLTGQTFTYATRVVVGAAGDMNLLGVGHLAIAARSATASVNNVEIDGYKEYDGELAHTRIARIAGEESIPIDVHGTSTSRCGEQGALAILDVMREAEAVDQGILIDGLSNGLTYICRSARESKDAALTVDVAAGELAKELGVADDDQSTRNSWTIERKGGQKATFEDTDGPMGTNTIGLYDSSKKLNILSDTDTEDYAAWLVRLGTVVGYRYPRVNLDLAKNPYLAAQWVTMLPSDRIDLTNANTVRTQLPDSTISVLVEGYSQLISRFTWDVAVNCSPAQPWQVGVYAADEQDLGELVARLSSDGSTLTAAVAEDDTTMTVVTPTGPLWTTDDDDYPLSLDVGGFEVTASACGADTGGGVQTFTITAAPGVIPLGAVVQLWRPPAPGL